MAAPESMLYTIDPQRIREYEKNGFYGGECELLVRSQCMLNRECGSCDFAARDHTTVINHLKTMPKFRVTSTYTPAVKTSDRHCTWVACTNKIAPFQIEISHMRGRVVICAREPWK